MNKIKYLITTLFVMMLLCLYANGNEVVNNQINNEPLQQYFSNSTIVLNDINSMGAIIDIMEHPHAIDIEIGNNFNERISDMQRFIVNGDGVEIANRKNRKYIESIYFDFVNKFKGIFVGAYAKEENFINNYLRILTEEEGGSLSRTLNIMVTEAHLEGNELIDDNPELLLDEKIMKTVNNIWVGHALRSIEDKIRENRVQKQPLFIFLPPKLSANTETVKQLINLFRIKSILRLSEATGEFLFSKTIMPRQNVYNILIDGHHTNHVHTALNLVREKAREHGMTLNQINTLFTNNLTGYINVSRYLDEFGLIDDFRNDIFNKNQERNRGNDNTCLAIRRYNERAVNNERITLKSVLVKTFERAIFNGSNRTVNNIFNGLPARENNNIEQEADVVQNRM